MRHTISISKVLRAGAILLALGSAATLAYGQNGAPADVPGQVIPSESTTPKPSVHKTIVPRRSSSTPSARKISRHKTKAVAKAPATSVTNTAQTNVSHDEHGDPSQAQQNADGTLNGSDWH
jgi:hypothetical protein